MMIFQNPAYSKPETVIGKLRDNSMKKTLLLISSLCLLGCEPSDNFYQDNNSDDQHYVFSGQDQYEQVSLLIFPKDFKVISNPKMPDGDFIRKIATPGSFIRKTVIEINKSDYSKFLRDNKFYPLTDTVPRILTSSLFDSIYQNISDKNIFLQKYGKKTGIKWAYFLDTTTYRLYCVISYPGYDGHAK